MRLGFSVYLFVWMSAMVRPAAAESPLSLAREGNKFYEQQRYQESIDAYRKALEKNPDEPLIRYNLGTILATDARYGDAEQILQEAAKAPNRFSDDAWFNLGVARTEKVLKENPQIKEYVTTPKPSTEAGSRIDPESIEKAMAQFKNAQSAFREAILAANNSQTSDAKYNYEMTQRMIDRLEELKKHQQQQQQQQQQQEQKNQDQKQDQQDQQDQQQNKDQQQQQEQNQQQQQSDEQKNQDQEQKQQEQKKSEEEKKKEKEKEQQQQQQQKQGEGEPKKQEPLTPEQMDAMRLLNLIEDERPEQFKKLFEFKGRRRAPATKDW